MSSNKKGDSVNVKVAVRLRPLNGREKERNSTICLEMSEGTTVITNPASDKKHRFTFDHSYWLDTAQATVYTDLGKPILNGAFDGYNGTIFAYGQTGSGKSYSMTGFGEDVGIIPLMNEEVFQRIEGATEVKFMVTVSFLEIYMEEVKDLLNPTGQDLKIREHPKLGVFVENLAELVVKNHADVMRLMEQGTKVRAVGSTNMNAQSSRSHSVFTLKIAQKKEGSMGHHAKINLVDLAGSERATSTGAEGARLKEGAAINKSLSALGNVINALAEGKKGHIPYRDSRLTRILQESLGGNTRTVMLAALSPASINFEETLSTLQYANRAKNITNVASKNEDENTRLIRELRGEIDKLRSQVSGTATDGTALDLQTFEMMQMRIQDLELAKAQTWEEKERLSQQALIDRKKNLEARGMMETVMESLKEENKQLKGKIADLAKQKEKMMTEYSEQKEKIEEQKALLQKEIQDYSKESQSGSMSEEDSKKRRDRIESLKNVLMTENDSMKNIKMKLKSIADQQKQHKEDAKAATQLLLGDTEIRRQIQEDERARLEEEHQQKLEEAKEQMRAELEAERQRVLDLAQQRLKQGGTVSLEEFTNLEMQLTEEKAKSKLLENEIAQVKKQMHKVEIEAEADADRVHTDFEGVQKEYFKIFRAYRTTFEQRQQATEKKYRQLLDRCMTDCLAMSSRAAKAEAKLQEMIVKTGFDPDAAPTTWT